MTYRCETCGYIYDEASGEPELDVAPGTPWDEIEHAFCCPQCGSPGSSFTAVDA